MFYVSTRSKAGVISSAQAIVSGIAPDGGLYVPQAFPQVSREEIQALSELPYHKVSARILSLFLDDFTQAEIDTMTAAAYGANFDVSQTAPLRRISPTQSVLELYHGPTLAFKDIALQLLPHLMSAAIKKTGQTKRVLILVATSGDTGKAALEGFKDVPGTAIAVFYPEEGVSYAQRLQMATQQGDNVYVCAVKGNFDDAQTGVKNIFADGEINSALEKQGFALSSANSINWGRLVPQIAYYFYAYAGLLKDGLKNGQKVDFVVPTGNFGNILAGYYAMRMGLPISKLVCASNSNRVLTDFFATGSYDRCREFHKTASPSMDILISSNLERLLFELCDRDAVKVAQLMEQLKSQGRYTLPEQAMERARAHFAFGWCSEEQTGQAIKQTFIQKHYLMDTHTAVGQYVYEEQPGGLQTVLLSTASPYKFPKAVLGAIAGEWPEDEFAAADRLGQLSGVPVPEAISRLKDKPLLHKDVCEKTGMAEMILNKAAKWNA